MHDCAELVANCFLEEVELTDLERGASIPLCKHFHQSTRCACCSASLHVATYVSSYMHVHTYTNTYIKLSMQHCLIRELSDKFSEELGRQNYVTPTSYLELISSFKALLASKRGEVLKLKKRYEVGLEKLEFAASQVSSGQD